MDRVESIENAILADSGGLFDRLATPSGIQSTTRDDLHVTIRIASDFYDFLVKCGESPDAYSIVYMSGTIRSGIDEFYLLAHSCRHAARDGATKSIDPHEHWDFPGLRERFMRGFEHLADPDMSGGDRLVSLFSLTHLELVFLARHFPSAILADSPSDSMTTNELLQNIKRMIGGKAAWTRKAPASDTNHGE